MANVAFLPGIQHASLAMPDIHWGYGFCIGGVCATDPDEGGVISPGGVGYDINCGVRLVRSNLLLPRRQAAPARRWSRRCSATCRPASASRAATTSTARSCTHLLAEGPRYLLGRGLATPSDIEHTEAHGRLDGADPDAVSDRALDRGAEQCGTLGSGNHFLEVQVVDHVFDEEAAGVMGLEKDMVCVMIHSGSRGLGYQVCDDALAMLRKAPEKYGIDLPDRQLACAPVNSPEGQQYIAAMRAAANFAWCNRQLLMQQAREVFADGLRPIVAGIADEPGLRRLPQHRQVRGAHGRRQDEAASGCIARARRGPFRRAIRRCRRCTARSASRSSSPATWAGRAGCWSASRAAWSRRSARPATAPAGP